MSDLEILSNAAAPGPWAYRPEKHDDWGTIRGGMIKTCIGDIRPPVAVSNPPRVDNNYDYEAHRKAGTDPMEANGRFIVELVNAYREGKLIDVDLNA